MSHLKNLLESSFASSHAVRGLLGGMLILCRQNGVKLLLALVISICGPLHVRLDPRKQTNRCHGPYDHADP